MPISRQSPLQIHLLTFDQRRRIKRVESDMFSTSTAPTINLIAFRSMLGLLERSCAGITPTRQPQSKTTAEPVISISVTTCQPENGNMENKSLELLEKCTLYSSKHNRSSDDVEGTLSLCKSLLNSSTQNAIVPNEDAAVCVPPPKVWMFLALGLLLLKELIALNFVQKSLLEEGLEEQRRSAEELQVLLQSIAGENFPSLLQHSEPRLRKICSEVLYVIACNERVDYKRFIEAGEARLGSVIKTIHFPLYHSTGSQLLSNVSDNLHRVSTSRQTNLGNEPLIPLDDTTGQ